MYAEANMGHPSKGVKLVCECEFVRGSTRRRIYVCLNFRSKQKAEENGRVPHVRLSVRGPKTSFFECFYTMSKQSLRSAHPIF
jgi:hypothetical protein